VPPWDAPPNRARDFRQDCPPLHVGRCRGAGAELTVQGSLRHTPDDGRLHYLAAAPPDLRTSAAGSALPFADAEQAFCNTPNRGTIHVGGPGNHFQVRLRCPNAYYAGLGTVYIPPTLHLKYMHGGRAVHEARQVSEGVPFRALTYPPARTGPEFYAVPDRLLRSQEQILYDSAFPDFNRQPADFWGGKPPL
jgi:hypothetical protein